MADVLIDLLVASVAGQTASSDPLLILPAPIGAAMAIVGVSGTYVIASAASEHWVRGRLAGDLMGPMSPQFIRDLGLELGRVDDGIDLVLAAAGLGGSPALSPSTDAAHSRLARASAHRESARAYTDETGAATVIIGEGLAGRLEISVEVAAEQRGQGVGRRALVEARRLLTSDQLLFAQIAPANARSLRAFLGAGFVPAGAEVLFFEGERLTA